jgi:hypothetical protein
VSGGSWWQGSVRVQVGSVHVQVDSVGVQLWVGECRERGSVDTCASGMARGGVCWMGWQGLECVDGCTYQRHHIGGRWLTRRMCMGRRVAVECDWDLMKYFTPTSVFPNEYGFVWFLFPNEYGFVWL